jgi:hypothetical protein
MIEVANEFPSGLWDEGKENELISSFCPSVFTLSTGHEIILPQPAAPQPLAVYMVDKIIKRLNRNWILAQISSLRRDGLSARIDVLKRKLKAKLI